MKRNLHTIDMSIRFVVAGICIYLGFFDNTLIQDSILAMAVGGFGVINLIAASLRFCPFYHLAGISTLPKSQN